MKPKDIIQSKELLLSESRRQYDRMDVVFQKIKEKLMLILTAELAILTLLFKDGFCFPEILSEQIFFSLSVGVVIFSICRLFYYYRSTKNWPVPVGDLEREKINHANSYTEVLDIANSDFIRSMKKIDNYTSEIAKAFNTSLLCFAICDIILLVLRFCA